MRQRACHSTPHACAGAAASRHPAPRSLQPAARHGSTHSGCSAAARNEARSEGAPAASEREPSRPATATSTQEEDEESSGGQQEGDAPVTVTFNRKQWFLEYAAAAQAPPLPMKIFRFWHDEKRFKGTGETSLAQRALAAAGGRRTGGNLKAAPTLGPLGWQRKAEWDILWSPASTAQKALEGGLLPGQLASAVPGTQSVCKKKRLVATLSKAYGEDAWGLVPRTYTLPVQVAAWRAWMGEHRGQASEGRLWMLKTAQHLGKGLALVPRHQAVKQVIQQYERAEQAKRHSKARAREVRPFVVAQQYIDDPLLLDGRKFGIRVWAAVTSYDPLRVYLHSGGLVLMSGEPYEPMGALMNAAGEGGGPVAGGHVTNYALNKDSEVWDLARLESHLGAEPYRRMYDEMCDCVARTYAAAAGPMRREAAKLGKGISPESCFELMGLDFLIDSSLKPWLLEVNSTPSLAVEHENDATERMIYEAKAGMVSDLFTLVQLPWRFWDGSSRVAGSDGAGAPPSAVATPLQLLRPKQRGDVGEGAQGAPGEAGLGGGSGGGDSAGDGAVYARLQAELGAWRARVGAAHAAAARAGVSVPVTEQVVRSALSSSELESLTATNMHTHT
ncbi:hypothetical protein FOA52_013183, partial [Chlamydomonas sp. UWO 241]